MIVKSMSRKVPSFGQLIGYIDRDEGQEAWRIRHNVFARNPERIRAEFEQNGELLKKRRNGVYLYHEIISITRAQKLSPEQQKQRLRDIAETYIAARCPDNMVFGGLHQDKDHSFHYHLMISANRAGETGRLRLSKTQFREIQVQLERHVLQTYPELEQKVAIDKRAERKIARGEAELERRTGAVPKKDQVRARVLEALENARDRDSLLQALGRSDLELYVRGKTLGVIDHESGKKHRLKTLDLEIADRVEAVMMDVSASREKNPPEGEKEKERERGAGKQRPEQNEHQLAGQEAEPERKVEARHEPETERDAGQSERQKAWRDEMGQHRQRGRDTPERGRE